MSGDEVNPAAVPQPVEDVQGDGRWISQVIILCSLVKISVSFRSINTGCISTIPKLTPETPFLGFKSVLKRLVAAAFLIFA